MEDIEEDMRKAREEHEACIDGALNFLHAEEKRHDEILDILFRIEDAVLKAKDYAPKSPCKQKKKEEEKQIYEVEGFVKELEEEVRRVYNHSRDQELEEIGSACALGGYKQMDKEKIEDMLKKLDEAKADLDVSLIMVYAELKEHIYDPEGEVMIKQLGMLHKCLNGVDFMAKKGRLPYPAKLLVQKAEEAKEYFASKGFAKAAEEIQEGIEKRLLYDK